VIKCYRNADAYHRLKSIDTKNKKIALLTKKIAGHNLIMWQYNGKEILLKVCTKAPAYYSIVPSFANSIIIIAVSDNYYKEHLKFWHDEKMTPYTDDFVEELPQSYNSLW